MVLLFLEEVIVIRLSSQLGSFLSSYVILLLLEETCLSLLGESVFSQLTVGEPVFSPLTGILFKSCSFYTIMSLENSCLFYCLDTNFKHQMVSFLSSLPYKVSLNFFMIDVHGITSSLKGKNVKGYTGCDSDFTINWMGQYCQRNKLAKLWMQYIKSLK